MSYIHYDEKPTGAIYACIYESYRNKGKVKARRGEKCKVYKDYAIPQEAHKEANAIYDIFKVQVPYIVPLATIEV